MIDPDAFYRPKQVVAATNAPRDLVYAALHAGELKAIKRGSRFYVPGWAVGEWLRGVRDGP